MAASWLQRLPSQAEMHNIHCKTVSLRGYEITILYDVSTIQWKYFNLPYGQRTDAHNL